MGTAEIRWLTAQVTNSYEHGKINGSGLAEIMWKQSEGCANKHKNL
jgi:hypothetical protein